MSSTKKNLSDTLIKLTLAADEATLQAAKKEALDHLGAEVKLPGFRPGTAPSALVEKNVRATQLQTEFLDRAMNALYIAALQEYQLRPVAQPKVTVKKFVPYDTLEIEADVEVVGEIKLPDYKKMKVVKKQEKVTEKEVNDVIEQLRKNVASADKKDDKEPELPKLDDAFAAKIGPFKTLKDLKDDIKKQLQNEKDSQAERAYADEIVMGIAKKAKAAIPDVLIDEQLEDILRELKQNLVYRGQTWQEFLGEQKLTEEKHREKIRPDAELRVKAGLVLGEIAEAEKLSVTRDELEAQIAAFKQQFPDEKVREDLDKPATRRAIASRLLTEKTINALKTYASK